MHFLRIHIHRRGQTAERLLAALAESRRTALMPHGPEFCGLRVDGGDREELLAEIERELEHLAATLGIGRWSDHLRVS